MPLGHQQGARTVAPLTVFTVGHGTRPVDELVATLREANVETLVDVRRYPASRRNPQFNQDAVRDAIEAAGLTYVHAVDLGGRRSHEPGEERFGCIRVDAFRSYAAHMGTPEWQAALDAALAEPAPCFMCAETVWWRCHRRMIAELLWARGGDVVHLLGPGKRQAHKPMDVAEARDGRLWLCGAPVA